MSSQKCKGRAACIEIALKPSISAMISETGRDTSASSLPDDLHQHPLVPVAIELAVEDLFPGAEVEFALGDGADDFPAHDLPLEVGVGVVFAGAVVVVVVGVGVEGGESLQPHAEVVVQARL